MSPSPKERLLRGQRSGGLGRVPYLTGGGEGMGGGGAFPARKPLKYQKRRRRGHQEACRWKPAMTEGAPPKVVPHGSRPTRRRNGGKIILPANP